MSILCRVLCAVVVVITTHCVPMPTPPNSPAVAIDSSGLFVVCEGLWRQDNAVLSFVDINGMAMRDVVSAVTPDLRLGDTGSDIVAYGDTLAVCVSGSQSIECFRRSTGAYIQRITLNSGEPYRMVLATNGVAYCTLISTDAIAKVDLVGGFVSVPNVPVGPAPEGIGLLNGRLYVANSGLGDLRKNEPGAGSVVVLDATELLVLDTAVVLPNVMQCIADSARQCMWFVYRHFVSQPDSLGGIVRYDVRTRTITDHIRVKQPKSVLLSPVGGELYVLFLNGVDRYEPETRSRTPIVSHTSANGNDVWYSLGWWHHKNAFVVGNARNYQTDGEIIVFTPTGNEILRAKVGLNPTAMR